MNFFGYTYTILNLNFLHDFSFYNKSICFSVLKNDTPCCMFKHIKTKIQPPKLYIFFFQYEITLMLF